MTNQFIKSNNLDLWYETFGTREHPPILLIQGSGAQGILWQKQFCEKLAQNGYYVIRYDLKDLMEDAKGILDALELTKAHIVGSSMGGYIAQLLGIQYPERVLTLTLMMSSLLSISLEHAFLEDNNPFSLPLPTKQFTQSLLEIGPVSQTQEGLIKYMLSIWSAYNGTAIPYDQIYWTFFAETWITRTKNLSASYNHRLAVSASPANRERELDNLKLPTLIVHGSVDPFFPTEHAHALQNAISSSSLVFIEKMGHLFHNAFTEEALNSIIPHLQKYET